MNVSGYGILRHYDLGKPGTWSQTGSCGSGSGLGSGCLQVFRICVELSADPSQDPEPISGSGIHIDQKMLDPDPGSDP